MLVLLQGKYTIDVHIITRYCFYHHHCLCCFSYHHNRNHATRRPHCIISHVSIHFRPVFPLSLIVLYGLCTFGSI
jgi:hypothetical protein